MPTIAGRRLAVVVLTAAITVAAMIAVSSATASPRPRTLLYHHFCPVMPDQVAAAGPYFAR